MRILLAVDLIYPDHLGGSHRFCYEVGKRLAARGHQVCVVTGRVRDSHPTAEELEGLFIRRFSRWRSNPLLHALSYWLGAARAYRQLASPSFDLISGHYALSTLGVLWAGGWRRPLVFTLHGPWGDEYGLEAAALMAHLSGWRRTLAQAQRRVAMALMHWLEGLCLRRAAKVHVLSQYGAQKAMGTYGVPSSKIHLIPGGVDTERFSPGNQREARRKLGLTEQEPILLTVRRLYARMGLENLVEAMALLRADWPQLQLLIVGTGPREATLREKMASLGLERQVHLLGYVADELLPDFYRAADLFVLPSLDLEGFGLATLEAMACGTLALGTPVGGTVEILGGFERSLLFADAQPESIAQGLRPLLGAAEARQALGARAREYALRHYSWEATTQQLEKLFGQVIGQREG